MASFDEAWMCHPWFDPLDFSNILGYPNAVDRDAFLAVPKYKPPQQWVVEHVLAFIEYLKAWDIVAEDVRMRVLVLSLDLQNNHYEEKWYKKLPPKGISSFFQLIKVIYDNLGPCMGEEISEAITLF